jgi:putative ABC transport system permease protein
MAIPLQYNLRSLLVRKLSTSLTIAGVGMAVAVFLIVLELANGLRGVILSAGSDDNLIVLRKGSANESSSVITTDEFQALKFLDGVHRDGNGNPDASPELAVQAFLVRNDNGKDNVMVRGILPATLRVHHQVRVIAGRVLSPGVREVMLGRQLVGRYKNSAVGSMFHFGRDTWKVAGIFEADGSAFESEVWCDLHDLVNDTRRGEYYSSVRLRCDPGADRKALIRRIASDPRIGLQALTEREYYERQSKIAGQLSALGVVLACVMGMGAAFAAMNTMYGALAARVPEIAVLRAIGFSRVAIFACFVIESLALALAGGVVGMALALPLNGLSTSFYFLTLSTLALQLRLTPWIGGQGLLFAALVGTLGGLMPARHAMRTSPIEAMRQA